MRQGATHGADDVGRLNTEVQALQARLDARGPAPSFAEVRAAQRPGVVYVLPTVEVVIRSPRLKHPTTMRERKATMGVVLSAGGPEASYVVVDEVRANGLAHATQLLRPGMVIISVRLHSTAAHPLCPCAPCSPCPARARRAGVAAGGTAGQGARLAAAAASVGA